ncbi:MAG: hypothetical protein SOV20_08935 [Coriobacteriales bacterium]|nr:hypothetical protein [Coriobacteriaceae bacterium]MDY2723923.1 hypothetical protein [Coriobacteriales bacterium]
MGGRGKEWTTGEIAELERLAKRHLTSAQIASIMGRTKDAVRGQAWHRGIKLQTTVRPWTRSELVHLAWGVRHGMTYAAIGEDLHRSRQAVVEKALELGIRRRRIHRWTPEDDAELLRMRSEGMTYRQCAERFGVTEPAAHMHTHRLMERERS